MKDSGLYYSVGALLYCPANHKGIARAIITETLGRQFSLALCLEDTIPDKDIKEAESMVVHTLSSIYEKRASLSFYVPKIFIRVRSARQISDLLNRLGSAAEILTGFIVPKFSLENADHYLTALLTANASFKKDFFIMPILESPELLSLRHRYSLLYDIKEKLESIEPLVLTIRVGGNDLCHNFGFRRNVDESIHDIGPISSLLSDIVTVFGINYVISGPVWEYYRGDGWDRGLKRELKEDRLCGFVGKTVIHPHQIPFVNSAYQVTQTDLNDAKAMLNWDNNAHSLVKGSVLKERMNEYKTHINWAKKILLLSETYGILPAPAKAIHPTAF